MTKTDDVSAGSTFADKAKQKTLKWAAVAGLLLLAFLLGLVPVWLKARGCASELEAAQAALVREQIAVRISSAVAEARRGEYESARSEASGFFTMLRTELDKESGGVFSDEEAKKVRPIFDGRDGTITLLVRKDPASAERLTDVYIAFFNATGVERAKSSENDTAAGAGQ